MTEPALSYATLTRRATADLIDTVLFTAPLWLLGFTVMHSRAGSIVWQVAFSLVMFGYQTWPVVRWGGTPGKLLLGVRITLVDGSRATWRAALLRVSVGTALGLIMLGYGIVVALQLSDDEYAYQDIVERMVRTDALSNALPGWQALYWLSNLWAWSELIVILFNKKRRSLHDFMAGTVVLRVRQREVG